MKLVRLALRVFDWLRKQDGAFERTFKSDSGGNIAFQESDDGCAGCNPLVGGRYAPGHSKSNAYNSIQDNAGIPSKYTTGMKGNNLSAPWHHSEFGCGALTHDAPTTCSNGITPKVAWSHSSCRIRKLLCPPVFDEFGLWPWLFGAPAQEAPCKF